MIVINTVSNKRFSLNGVEYLKNFLSFVAGNRLLIYNAYDRKDERTELTLFSDYTVNGVIYGSAAILQSALLDIIYSRGSLGGEGTPIEVVSYKDDFIADETQEFTVPTGIKIKNAHLNRSPAYANEWYQIGDVVTVTSSEVGDKITLTN